MVSNKNSQHSFIEVMHSYYKLKFVKNLIASFTAYGYYTKKIRRSYSEIYHLIIICICILSFHLVLIFESYLYGTHAENEGTSKNLMTNQNQLDAVFIKDVYTSKVKYKVGENVIINATVSNFSPHKIKFYGLLACNPGSRVYFAPVNSVVIKKCNIYVSQVLLNQTQSITISSAKHLYANSTGSSTAIIRINYCPIDKKIRCSLNPLDSNNDHFYINKTLEFDITK